MDLPEPPRVVFEQPAPCTDSAHASELLRRALAPSVAPHGGWTVTMRVIKDGTSLRAEGEISDESEAPVAHRSLAKETRDCSALAKAVGVWASLVLDQELASAQEEAANGPKPESAVRASPEVLWPAPAPPPEKPSPESALFLKEPEDKRIFELGAGTWLMGGTGSGVIAGPSIFAVIETGNAWFLRPQIALGRTVTEISHLSDVYATWGAMRFDACKRVPGNYLDHRGMQLDLCGGSDVGFLHFDSASDVPDAVQTSASGRSLPFFAIGPSIGLRGELGSDLSAILRGVAEINLLREKFVDLHSDVEPSLFVGRAEVGVSWRLR